MTKKQHEKRKEEKTVVVKFKKVLQRTETAKSCVGRNIIK